MNLGNMDPALGCSGLMSILSYDSHRVTRGARITETRDIRDEDNEDNNRYRMRGHRPDQGPLTLHSQPS